MCVKYRKYEGNTGRLVHVAHMISIATANIPRLIIKDTSRTIRHQLLYTVLESVNHPKIPKVAA